MKRLLVALAAIGIVSGVAGWLGTTAFFSDSETSVDNAFIAGELDLTVDSTAHYAGMICTDIGGGVYQWKDEDTDETNNPRPELLNQPCEGTWSATNLAGERFVNLADLKPGDSGENTISLHLATNEAWACVQMGNVASNDNGLTDPEADDGDVTDGDGFGELDQALRLIAWLDDGDNIWQDGEQWLVGPEDSPVTLADFAAIGGAYPLFEPGNDPMQPDTDYFIGAYWCFGEVGFDGTSLSCDGGAASNVTQTDSVRADIAFYVEQARNNDSFACENVDLFPDDQAISVGAALASYDLPDPDTECDWIVDDDGGDAHFTSIAAAVASNDVQDGNSICVAEGIYNEFTVDRPLTIKGLVNPETSATVVPSSAGVTDLAVINSSDVSILGLHFNGAGFDFTGFQLAGIRIQDNGANMNNIMIAYNLIENLHATHANASSKGIQWHDDGSGFSLTNSGFMHNVIRNIQSDSKGAYGIQTVGDTDGLAISRNTISDVSGSWGAGVALDGSAAVSNTLTVVSYNQIVDSIIANFSVQVEANVDASGVSVNNNNLEALLFGGSSGTPSPDVLNAENNWWGTATPALGVDVFVNPGTNVVDFDPAAPSAYALN